MGLLDDYGIDTTDVEVPSYDVEDGWYRFTIGDCYVKEGSTNNPDASWLIIDYQLEDEEGNAKGKVSDLFSLPADPESPTDDERKKIGWYVKRMLDLGFDRSEINDVERDDIIGLTGALELRTRPGKGKNAGKSYQNIVKVVADDEPSPEPVKPPKAEPKTKAAPKTAKANPFAK